ncbi:dihydrofolate reductase [Actinoplanes sp. TBRC 11911]|uniref:dihydrofolate reductase family protein n=1 Tax=Actinoplanes sp. TBRC 11911 TaxID=2729386 RepID=UPI00145D3308|nr:dihydrofolate reductase family protein [Actinoplanes sp. TBRC 11911]NMO56956.1 dihydrofolate reductase [Actinoplanes sp. TBRC 11911]
MRKLSATMFMSLDGVIQAPGGPGEDGDGDFPYGGWAVTYFDDRMGTVMDEFLREPVDLVLGRRTYDIFAGYWPQHADEQGVGMPFARATKYVASRGKPDLSWDKSVLLKGDAARSVAALKKDDGRDLQVHGSVNLLQTLMRAGLVDEYLLWTFPVLVGTGKRLFTEGVPAGGLELVDTTTSTTGVVINRYRPSGDLKTGTF